MTYVLSSVRMVLFHIMKLNAFITCAILRAQEHLEVAKPGGRVMMDDDIELKEFILVKFCQCCLLGAFSGISYLLTSSGLVLSRGISIGKEKSSWG